MKHLTTRQLVELSLYAALIFVSVQCLRIPMGAQFVHFGNALVVVAVLLYGSRLGALVAAVGLGLFDVLHGFLKDVILTPELFNFFLAIDKVHVRINFVVHNCLLENL